MVLQGPVVVDMVSVGHGHAGCCLVVDSDLACIESGRKQETMVWFVARGQGLGALWLLVGVCVFGGSYWSWRVGWTEVAQEQVAVGCLLGG